MSPPHRDRWCGGLHSLATTRLLECVSFIDARSISYTRVGYRRTVFRQERYRWSSNERGQPDGDRRAGYS